MSLSRATSVSSFIGTAGALSHYAPSHGTVATHPVSPLRYLALGQFCLFSSTVAMQWINFANVGEKTRDVFGCDQFQVDALNWVYMLIFVALGPVGFFVFDVFGLKRGVICGSVCNWLGALLKLIAAMALPSYWLLLAGSILAAVAQPFLLEVPPLLSVTWFADSERTLATTIAAAANSVGVAFGMLIPPLVVGAFGDARTGFAVFFGVQLGMATLDLALTLFAVPGGPKVPPSAAAEKRASGETSSLSSAETETAGLINPGAAPGHGGSSWLTTARHAGHCLKNPHYSLLVLSMGTVLGGLWGASSVLSQLLQPFGISAEMSGWMGFASIMVGTVSAIVLGKMVDATRRYRLPMLGIVGFGCLVFAALVGALVVFPSPVVPVFLLYTLLGVAQSGAVPIAFEFAAELTFPVDEAVSGGLLMEYANALSLGLMLGVGRMLGDHPTKAHAMWGFAVFGATWVVPVVALLFVRERLQRKVYEAEQDHVSEPATPRSMCDENE